MKRIVVERQTLEGLLEMAAEFYAQPENQKAYQRWRAEKRKRKKPGGAKSTDEPKE